MVSHSLGSAPAIGILVFVSAKSATKSWWLTADCLKKGDSIIVERSKSLSSGLSVFVNSKPEVILVEMDGTSIAPVVTNS